MLIPQVQVGNVLYPLAEGQPLPIAVGQAVKIFYAFNYKMPETASIEIWASLYKYSYGIFDRQGQAQTKETIVLEKALVKQPYEGEIDIVIGNIPAGIYGLILELPHYGIEDHIDDSIEITTVPSIWDMLGPLLILGLMAGIMVPMMKEGF